MDTPIHSAARVETELEALLLTIETIALTRVRDFGLKHARADLAHNIVLDCQIKIRRGRWDVARPSRRSKRRFTSAQCSLTSKQSPLTSDWLSHV